MLPNSLPQMLNVSTPVVPLTLQIVNVQRYIRDAVAELMLPSSMESGIYSLYDLTLCDAVNELKCVLHPNFNSVIERGEVERDTLVLVKNYKRIFDETKIGGGDPIVVLTDIASLSEIEIEPPVTKLTKLNAMDKWHVPLIGHRGYYVPVWNNDCFDCNHSSIFPQTMPTIDEEDLEQLMAEQISFTEIQENFIASQEAACSFPTRTVIGRIIKKSPVHHFALKSDSHKPFQMKFELQIAHGTSVLNITIWNRLCAMHYYALDIGTVIGIQRFRVQRK